uniref:Probable ribosome biogenesis protein RLP24 n=1 Tax=Romanomermis culicivorax TaxID=13658 RepID=A0A915J0E2_ROMCU
MRLEKCYFCSSTIYPGHGITFVRNDCTIFRFCRSKCRKSFNMKRNPRKVKWTKASRKARGKDLVQDSVLDFEKRRNESVQYNRELWDQVVDAAKTSQQIKDKRAGQYIKARLDKGKVLRKRQDLKNLEKNIHLIKSPAAGLKAKHKVKIEAPMSDDEQENAAEELMETN